MNAVQKKLSKVLPLVDGAWIKERLDGDPSHWSTRLSDTVDTYLSECKELDIEALQIFLDIDDLSSYSIGREPLVELLSLLPCWSEEAAADGVLDDRCYQQWGYVTMQLSHILIEEVYGDVSEVVPHDLQEFMDCSVDYVAAWYHAVHKQVSL